MTVRVALVIVACGCALAVLFGVDLDHLKLLAVGVLAAAIATVVP